MKYNVCADCRGKHRYLMRHFICIQVTKYGREWKYNEM